MLPFRKYWLVLLLLGVVIVPLARSGMRAYEVISGEQVLGLDVIRRQWEPHPVQAGCGILYIWAEGTEADLAKNRDSGLPLKLRQAPYDLRFRHTQCLKDWWKPASDLPQVLSGSTRDGPPLPFSSYDYEFVISATPSGVYYEQRTLPKKKRSKQLAFR